MSDQPTSPDADKHELLRAYLNRFDAPCPCCNYNLRALPGSRCPECNQELILHVGLAEPHPGPYLGALCGLLAGVGVNALILAFLAVISILEGPPTGREAWVLLGFPFLSLLLCAPTLSMILRRPARVWFHKANPQNTFLAILGCWMLPVGCATGFIVALCRL